MWELNCKSAVMLYVVKAKRADWLLKPKPSVSWDLNVPTVNKTNNKERKAAKIRNRLKLSTTADPEYHMRK